MIRQKSILKRLKNFFIQFNKITTIETSFDTRRYPF